VYKFIYILTSTASTMYNAARVRSAEPQRGYWRGREEKPPKLQAFFHHSPQSVSGITMFNRSAMRWMARALTQGIDKLSSMKGGLSNSVIVAARAPQKASCSPRFTCQNTKKHIKKQDRKHATEPSKDFLPILIRP